MSYLWKSERLRVDVRRLTFLKVCSSGFSLSERATGFGTLLGQAKA